MAVLTPARKERLHRRGILLEWCTVAWNVIEAVVAIGVGLVVGSVALVATDRYCEDVSFCGCLEAVTDPEGGEHEDER
jgi:hypothetical protein